MLKNLKYILKTITPVLWLDVLVNVLVSPHFFLENEVIKTEIPTFMGFQFVSQTLHNVEKLSRETMLKIWSANLVSKIRIGLTTCDGRKFKIVLLYQELCNA